MYSRGLRRKCIICVIYSKTYFVPMSHSNLTNWAPMHSNFSLLMLTNKQKVSDSQYDSSGVMKLLRGGLSSCNYIYADSYVCCNFKNQKRVPSRNLSYNYVYMHGSAAVGPAHNDVTVNIPAQVPPALVSLPTVSKPLTSTRLYCT